MVPVTPLQGTYGRSAEVRSRSERALGLSSGVVWTASVAAVVLQQDDRLRLLRRVITVFHHDGFESGHEFTVGDMVHDDDGAAVIVEWEAVEDDEGGEHWLLTLEDIADDEDQDRE